jgi:hypothetical protein
MLWTLIDNIVRSLQDIAQLSGLNQVRYFAT